MRERLRDLRLSEVEARMIAKVAYTGIIEAHGFEYQADDFKTHDAVGRSAERWCVKRELLLEDVLVEWVTRWWDWAEVPSANSWLTWVKTTAAGGNPSKAKPRRASGGSARLAPSDGAGFDEFDEGDFGEPSPKPQRRLAYG